MRTAEQPAYANDQLSRGWDYIGLAWKKTHPSSYPWRISTYLTLKYFLSHGLLQGAPEEYNDWENDSEGKSRNRVNGVSGKLELQWKDINFGAFYETGYHDIFRYNTTRLQIGKTIGTLPVFLWGQVGHGSDLAQYYKKVSSWGIAVEIK